MDEEVFKFEERKNARKGQAPKASALLEAHKLLRTLAPYFANGVPNKTLLEAVLAEIDQKHQLNTTEVPQSIWVLYVVGRIRILMNQLRLCHQQECKNIALMNQVVDDDQKRLIQELLDLAHPGGAAAVIAELPPEYSMLMPSSVVRDDVLPKDYSFLIYKSDADNLCLVSAVNPAKAAMKTNKKKATSGPGDPACVTPTKKVKKGNTKSPTSASSTPDATERTYQVSKVSFVETFGAKQLKS